VISIGLKDLERISERVSEGSEKTIIYVDNADVLLRFLGIDKAVRALCLIGERSLLLTRLYYQSWTDTEILRLHSVCSNILRIYTAEKLCICETTIEKKDGSIGKTVSIASHSNLSSFSDRTIYS
jgi:hypothetical protein